MPFPLSFFLLSFYKNCKTEFLVEKARLNVSRVELRRFSVSKRSFHQIHYRFLHTRLESFVAQSNIDCRVGQKLAGWFFYLANVYLGY